jgi:hypothetical protein
VTTCASVLASSTGFDWIICVSVSVLAAGFWAYRTTTRLFDWGPRDT